MIQNNAFMSISTCTILHDHLLVAIPFSDVFFNSYSPRFNYPTNNSIALLTRTHQRWLLKSDLQLFFSCDVCIIGTIAGFEHSTVMSTQRLVPPETGRPRLPQRTSALVLMTGAIFTFRVSFPYSFNDMGIWILISLEIECVD